MRRLWMPLCSSCVPSKWLQLPWTNSLSITEGNYHFHEAHDQCRVIHGGKCKQSWSRLFYGSRKVSIDDSYGTALFRLNACANFAFKCGTFVIFHARHAPKIVWINQDAGRYTEGLVPLDNACARQNQRKVWIIGFSESMRVELTIFHCMQELFVKC